MHDKGDQRDLEQEVRAGQGVGIGQRGWGGDQNMQAPYNHLYKELMMINLLVI